MQECQLTKKYFNKLDEKISISSDITYTARIRLEPNDTIKKKLCFYHTASSIKTRFDLRFVLFGNSTLDIEVVVNVGNHVENVDTYLSIKALIVGQKARARVVPTIEILQDKVKGGHGATVGYIDPVSLNYMQSRGLNKSDAEKILIEAFLTS